jgi:hypothetical protein
MGRSGGDKYITFNAIKCNFDMNENVVRDLIESGKLSTVRMGGTTLYKSQDIKRIFSDRVFNVKTTRAAKTTKIRCARAVELQFSRCEQYVSVKYHINWK